MAATRKSATAAAGVGDKGKTKAGGGVSSASSTKHVSAAGARVTTVSTGAHQASKEPDRVSVTVDPTAALGISFAVGGVVRQVAPKGQVAALGVREGWRLTDIGGGGRKTADTFSVTATSTSKDVLGALAAARKRGKPYTLVFSATTTEGQARETGKEEQGEGRTTSRDDDGSPGGAACIGVEQQSGDTRNSGDVEYGEGKELEEQERSSPVVGNGGTGNGVAEDGGGEAAKGVPPEEPLSERGDGEVTLMYEMYDEKFPIKGGCVSSAEIDETYCLSFVMPNCTLHLGPMSPADRYAQENNGEVVPYLQEEPPGTFHGLVDGGVYWVYVSRDDEEEKQDRERMKQVVEGMQQDLPDGGGERKDDGRNGLESCSCVYGNPCVDEYGCKDWHARYAVAKANGWKGF